MNNKMDDHKHCKYNGKIEVVKGDKVDKGQLIAKSGDTGYVLGPHLHITVRINGISIDPMKFMALLGE